MGLARHPTEFASLTTTSQRLIDATTERDSAKERFLTSLVGDLARLGARIRIQRTTTTLRLTGAIPAVLARAPTPDIRAEQVNRRIRADRAGETPGSRSLVCAAA